MRTARTQRPAALVRQLDRNKKSVDEKTRAHASRHRRVRTLPPTNRGMGGAKQVSIFSEQVWGLVLGSLVADENYKSRQTSFTAVVLQQVCTSIALDRAVHYPP